MTRRRPTYALLGALVLVGALVTAGCAQSEVGDAPPQQTHTGIPERGAEAIQKYGCGTCHTIPGVTQADGLVGPPLTQFAHRSYIAGELPNNARNLQHWIEDPQGVEPGTAMPNLGVTPREAQDITAYLYTLK